MEKNKTLDYINSRIKKEICYTTIENLNEKSLMDDYINSKSAIKINKNLDVILKKYVNDKTKTKIMDELICMMIPAGLKGVIRGNKFNNIVKNYILNLGLNEKLFEICFEKKCLKYFTAEIPDWYILEKSTNRIILGMNQLDLWSGGHQLNRGSKYIDNNIYDNKNCKLLCVICNEIYFKNEKNKIYNLFKIGFENNTLCYINNIKTVIHSYFNIE